MKQFLIFAIAMLKIIVALGQKQKDTVIYFGFDKFQITHSNETILQEFISNSNCDTMFIDGYADCVGTEDYNQRLSEKRATTTKNYLQKIKPDITYVISAYGEKEASVVQNPKDRKVVLKYNQTNIFLYDSIYGIFIQPNTLKWMEKNSIKIDSIVILRNNKKWRNADFKNYYYFFPYIDIPSNIFVKIIFSNSFIYQTPITSLQRRNDRFYSLDIVDIINSKQYKIFINNKK